MIILDDTVALLAPTLRSKVYIQNMVKRKIFPSLVIILPGAEPLLNGTSEYVVTFDALSDPVFFSPNLSLLEILTKSSIPIIISETSDVNSEAFIRLLNGVTQTVVIYSGMPGVILKEPILNCGKKYLHVHGGYVPEYKGSTAFYYSMFEDGTLGVSAIWLESKLDSGLVLMKKAFVPQRNYDIDHIFEPMARASLLIDILRKRVMDGVYPEGERSTSDVDAYYVIHPLLKHITLRKCLLI